MPHVVLLGDSIFDNARYVPGRPSVIEQLRRSLPADWQATLLAVDGHTVPDVPRQMRQMPADATHLVVSAGGNDALGESGVLHKTVVSVGEALSVVRQIQVNFQNEYRAMLRRVLEAGKPTAVCTVYDAIPGLDEGARTALGLFNEVILREACLVRVPVIDLRLVCDQPGDYSEMSPIEPSMAGGSKIARTIAQLVTSHDFTAGRSAIYC